MRIAVVGSGISGLAAAWLLSQRHTVTVYEAAWRPGGQGLAFCISPRCLPSQQKRLQRRRKSAVQAMRNAAVTCPMKQRYSGLKFARASAIRVNTPWILKI